NRPEDYKISGTLKVFYANKECFVAGSALSGNPACLLWRRPHAREKHRPEISGCFRKRHRVTNCHWIRRMKQVNFGLWLTCFFAFVCIGEQLDGFDFIFMRKASRKIVRRLLQDKDVLLISRAIYGRPDYPMCVQSRPLGFYAQKIRANFSYYEKDLNAVKTNGHRIYR
ncbi:hypothetical protein MTO96_025647, partial [Rhipicephalus appendiculatus]